MSGPADLVAAVPYLVGFTPRHSLVLMSLRGPKLRCGLTARVDLPDDPAHVEPLAAQLVRQLLQDGPDQIALLVYDAAPWRPATRPWQRLVDAVEAELTAVGVGLKEAAYVGADRFWSFSCHEPSCCPDAGTPLDRARTSAAAAALVVSGRAPAGDRDDLVARISPSDPVAVRVVTRMARARRAAVAADDLAEHGARVEQLFAELVQRYLDPQLRAVSHDEAATVLAALTDVAIRDAVAMRWISWLREHPGDGGRRAAPALRLRRGEREAVTALLADLVRLSDRTWAVCPLTLYAMQCWRDGEGALANLAIERALGLDPGYRMALLVDGLLRAGVRPHLDR